MNSALYPTTVRIGNVDLLPAEYEALLEVIRRDLRAERLKRKHAPLEREWHCANVRMSIRLLELLNPKRQQIQKLFSNNTSKV